MEAVLIPLSGSRGYGKFAIVEYADLHLVEKYLWFVSTRGYVCTSLPNGRGKQMRMHHVIVGSKSKTDHKNRNKLDNRRHNLRTATDSQNNANRIGWSRSGFKGVTRQGAGRFVSRIKVMKKEIHLGSFCTAEDAARAYDRAALEHFGEFSRLNFPQQQPAA